MSGKGGVGYGKPPEHTRFRKGTSGNPHGRPKNSRNLKTDLVEELKESVVVREGSVEKHVTKQRAMLKSMTLKAIAGDTRAMSVMFNIMARLLDVETAPDEEQPLSDDEKTIVAMLEQRLLQRTKQSRNVVQPEATEVNARSQSDDE